MNKTRLAVIYALTAALCYGLSAPFSKLLLRQISPAFLASLLYWGAGLGMLAVYVFPAKSAPSAPALSGKDFPWLAAMVLLDAAAPMLLLWGLQTTTPATVALLNNFEIAATALIAFWLFKETVSKRLWAAVVLITAASVLLTVDDFSALSFSKGALLALAASICWGFENNTTRQLSAKNPVQTVMVKGFGSGSLSLCVAAYTGQIHLAPGYIFGALLLGALAYGCSVYFYILAQRYLGAARTGVFYAAAPFMGVLFSFMLIGQPIGWSFCTALALMLAGTWLAAADTSSRPEVP